MKRERGVTQNDVFLPANLDLIQLKQGCCLHLARALALTFVATLQLARQIFNTQSLAGQQDNQVVNHVRRFIDKAVIGSVGRFDDGFDHYRSSFG